jgi:hypothetical protein
MPRDGRCRFGLRFLSAIRFKKSGTHRNERSAAGVKRLARRKLRHDISTNDKLEARAFISRFAESNQRWFVASV